MNDPRQTPAFDMTQPGWLRGVHLYSAAVGAAAMLLVFSIVGGGALLVNTSGGDDGEAGLEPSDRAPVDVADDDFPEPLHMDDEPPAGMMTADHEPVITLRPRNDDPRVNTFVGPPPPDVLAQIELLPSTPVRRPAPRVAAAPRPRRPRRVAPRPVPLPTPEPAQAAEAPSEPASPSPVAATPEPAGEAVGEPAEAVTTVVIGDVGSEPEPAAPPEPAGPVTFESSPPGKVYLRLTTAPVGADITVDGRFRGRTPAKLTLDPGEYDVVLAYGSARTKLEVDADEDIRLCFSVGGRTLDQVPCSQL